MEHATSPSTSLAAVWLAARDDVATALRALVLGETIVVGHEGETQSVDIREPIPLGHKFALHALERGTRVRKYGEYIGRLTADVPAGGWVHTHNLATAARRTTAEELAWREQVAPPGGRRRVPRQASPADGSACSRDGRTRYVAHPAHGYVLAHEAGREGPRVFADLGGLPGEPTAVAVDAEDHVWVALAEAGALLRYTPDGALVRAWRVPVATPAALAFGPPGSHELHVIPQATSSHHDNAMFVLDAGVDGAPARRDNLP